MTTFAGKQPGYADPTLSHPDNTGLAPASGEVTFAGVQPGYAVPVVIGSVPKLAGADKDV